MIPLTVEALREACGPGGGGLVHGLRWRGTGFGRGEAHSGRDRGRDLAGAYSRVFSTGVQEIDESLPGGGLARGVVHEWIGVGEDGGAFGGRVARRGWRGERWTPAMGLVVELARRAAVEGRATVGGARTGWLIWIGREVWPYAPALSARGVSPRRCLFVRARREQDRLWAADLVLRSGTVSASGGVLVVNGSRFDIAATRRLQLAAEASGGVCIVARPPWEASELSAAGTRWLVSCAAGGSAGVKRWKVELVRCKAGGGMAGDGRAWVVERDHATGGMRVAGDVRDGPGEATVEAGWRGVVRRTG
ncbi:MAG: hypothetical protein GIKADHBN_00260 [Phycisphaerales bacterium]|nr:hypothetical protein [Phycisphaerales bacterium]